MVLEFESNLNLKRGFDTFGVGVAFLFISGESYRFENILHFWRICFVFLFDIHDCKYKMVLLILAVVIMQSLFACDVIISNIQAFGGT